MKVNEQISKGVRLKDMPDEWFAVPTDEAMKNSMVVVMRVFACNRLMDSGRFQEANKLMTHMLEIDSGMVGVHRNLMICDRTYVELITENRRDVIDGDCREIGTESSDDRSCNSRWRTGNDTKKRNRLNKIRPRSV